MNKSSKADFTVGNKFFFVTNISEGTAFLLQGLTYNVNWAAVFVETVFESSFGFTYVLFEAVVVLYHVNDVFRVTVDVMSDRSGFTCRVECV